MLVTLARVVAFCALLVAAGCGPSKPDRNNTTAPIQLEQIPSSEVTLTGRLLPSPQNPVPVQVGLRNVGTRTLPFEFLRGFPLAGLAFSVELANGHWLEAICTDCRPNSLFGQLDTCIVDLKPSHSLWFTIPLKNIAVWDQESGRAIDIGDVHGHLMVSMGVPTPPDAHKNWPGIATVFIALP